MQLRPQDPPPSLRVLGIIAAQLSDVEGAFTTIWPEQQAHVHAGYSGGPRLKRVPLTAYRHTISCSTARNIHAQTVFPQGLSLNYRNKMKTLGRVEVFMWLLSTVG